MQENQDRNSMDEYRKIVRMIKVEEEGIPPEIKKELWQNIKASIVQKNRIDRLKAFAGYAAATVLLAATAAIYPYLDRHDKDEINFEAILAENFANKEVTENVVVVFPDNGMIEIEDKNAELVLDKQGKMSVNSKIIEGKKLSKPSAAAYNQLIVPYGKTSSIIMSDGTKIWVNAGSRVVYPTIFNERRREIYVEGEVYLEVAHNPDCPFILKTNELEVNVLGTSFNVEAYKNDDYQSVVLAAGSVSVKKINNKDNTTIKPNQKFTFEPNTQITRLENVDVLNFISWKYGFLIFEKEKLYNVLKKIERYYNIRLSYNPEKMKHISLSGKLDLKDDIEETCKIISITAPVEYVIGENEIIINVKP
ncbi:MAG: FecR family protein [Tannerellaceae bacterium]|jgi:hypothetical protein|nr:FecR family protein [Tannerellaceae bacterium]